MKLIVQIPCFNEEQTLTETVRDIPRQIPGVDTVEVLVLDDGSTDRTVEVAKLAGADHIISLGHHQGLAKAFMAAIDASIRLGADLIVNTDADNQYDGRGIQTLITPILEGRAEMVIGDRQIDALDHFSPVKKILQKVGSWVVRQASNTDIPDTASGFRAYSKRAALRLTVFSSFTYTLETLIQAEHKGIQVAHVPVRTRANTRPSRLIKSNWHYVTRSIVTIIRIYAMYRPLAVFSLIGGMLLLGGFAISGRFLYYYMQGAGGGKIQSLIFAAVLILLGFQILMMGLLSDLVSANRRLMEDILVRLKWLNFSAKDDSGQAGRRWDEPQ
ncbi:glycosyltransferase family 2 protein [Candidatus Methylomirabilis sp.]|uniref:glycosyltransferase family 2 protein n=1 Tax=Candidatus Methylomirabilis sp. TaxID=2032687 RepID=UPI0030764D98